MPEGQGGRRKGAGDHEARRSPMEQAIRGILSRDAEDESDRKAVNTIAPDLEPHPDMTDGPRRAPTAGWLLILFVFLSSLYLALPTAHHSYDAVAYALDVEHAVVTGSSERLWHDYHILYNPLGYALYALGRPAGLHPLMMMQMGNALAGALVAP